MPETEGKPPILERQSWNFIFLALLFALCSGVFFFVLYSNPNLNPEVPVQRIEAQE